MRIAGYSYQPNTCSIELWGGRACRPVPFILNLFQDFKNRIVVWDAIGIEITAIRKTLELAPLALSRIQSGVGQSIANSPLIRLRQTLNQLYHMQRGCAHTLKFNTL